MVWEEGGRIATSQEAKSRNRIQLLFVKVKDFEIMNPADFIVISILGMSTDGNRRKSGRICANKKKQKL